jgi:nicotinamide mononucleotide transporter
MILVFSVVSGWLLESYTNAALPFLDALVTWGAVVATYMVAKKVLENWIYWFVIDTISIFLFVARDLWITALLFMIYIVIILFGYRSWKKVHNESNSTTG